MSDTGIIGLLAYLCRQAVGLEDMDPVVLDAGAETVREMAMGAKREHDQMRDEILRLRRELDAKGRR